MTTKIRLYFSDKIQSELISYLTREQSHYVKDVMRLKTGDSFSAFNSQGEWNAIVESYEKDGARIWSWFKPKMSKCDFTESTRYTTLYFQALGDGAGGLRRKSVVKNEVRKHEHVCFECFSCVVSLGNVIFRSASTS